MKAIHNILTVSKYESKTLFRSWFFRIFSILALIFVFVFNLFTQTSIGWPMGDMVALPAMVPFVNLYIINIAQAIIAVFLASDFLKRDKKLDTTEVIYMRSMTNADYVIGKTIGNVWVFFMLNFVALGMVAIFNISSIFTQFSPAPYLYYFLLISLPTLIFILGFSFFLMSVIKNQAVTFVILLGYIAATLFYLQNVYHYLFDYMAFHLPMTFSDFVGFGSLSEILIHRGIYLFLGLGFISLTILLLQRLPQSTFVRKVTMVASVVFLSLGIGLGVKYITKINNYDAHRAQMLSLNNNYATSANAEIKKCDIVLEHKGEQIVGEATITLTNPSADPLTSFVLSLNPGLSITALSGANYTRDLQIIKVTPNAPLQKGSELTLKISYQGDIDESLCYLDMNRERLDLWLQRGNGIADKKHAFVRSDYLLLTPETRWYPMAGITYSSVGLKWQTMQFIDFHLRVKTSTGLKAISQGKVTDDGNGSFEFAPEHKLPQISLAVGKYESRSIVVDKVNYSLNFLKGHNTFDPFFKILKDSIKPVIRDLRKSWEAKVRFTYPYERLNLVEIPVQFCSFSHVWTGAGEQVQPETVYLPEGGFKLSSTNFAEQKRISERYGGYDNQTISPKETEENYFKRFVNDVLLSSKTSPSRMGMGGPMMHIGSYSPPQEELNPYFIFPNYYTYLTYLKSDQYPIVNRAIESYLSKAATETGSSFMRSFTGLSEIEKGNIALQDASFAEILDKQADPDIINNVILTKSGFLFALMKGAVGPDKFDEFIHRYIDQKKFESSSVDVLNEQLKSSFSLDLNQYLPTWYSSKSLPGYVVTHITTAKLKKDDQIKTMVSFVITNTENDPGAVSVTFRMGSSGRGGFRRRGGAGSPDDNIEKTVLIGGKVSRKITYLFNREPRSITINTFASHNIPSSITQQFGKIDIDETLQAVDDDQVVAYTEGVEANEIILDNEDRGFKLSQPKSNSLIQRLLIPSEADGSGVLRSSGANGKSGQEIKYKGLLFWNPPVEWTLTTNEQFYGKQIRSAYYLKGGIGDRKAIWNVPVKVPGYYKVSAYLPKIKSGWGREELSNEDYHFTIFHDDGKDNQIVEMKNNDSGWIEIGSYHLSPDSIKIELSNLTKARAIYADAVKLVKIN